MYAVRKHKSYCEYYISETYCITYLGIDYSNNRTTVSRPSREIQDFPVGSLIRLIGFFPVTVFLLTNKIYAYRKCIIMRKKTREGRESGPLFVCGHLENVYLLQNMQIHIRAHISILYASYKYLDYNYAPILYRHHPRSNINEHYYSAQLPENV